MIENNKNKEAYIFGRSNIPNKSFDEEKFKANVIEAIEFLRNQPVPEISEEDEIRDNFIKANKYLNEINWDMNKVNFYHLSPMKQENKIFNYYRVIIPLKV